MELRQEAVRCGESTIFEILADLLGYDGDQIADFVIAGVLE